MIANQTLHSLQIPDEIRMQWFYDSCASQHITNQKHKLRYYKPPKSHLRHVSLIRIPNSQWSDSAVSG